MKNEIELMFDGHAENEYISIDSKVKYLFIGYYRCPKIAEERLDSFKSMYGNKETIIKCKDVLIFLLNNPYQSPNGEKFVDSVRWDKTGKCSLCCLEDFIINQFGYCARCWTWIDSEKRSILAECIQTKEKIIYRPSRNFGLKITILMLLGCIGSLLFFINHFIK